MKGQVEVEVELEVEEEVKQFSKTLRIELNGELFEMFWDNSVWFYLIHCACLFYCCAALSP